MTRTTPLRRIILQLRQIFFTDADTFLQGSYEQQLNLRPMASG